MLSKTYSPYAGASSRQLKNRGQNHQYMDKLEPRQELMDDLTRESLIAISYGVPDTDHTTEISPKSMDGARVVEPLSCDGEEKYRSKLISLSYSPSPDMEVPQPLPQPLDV
ncbi:hypothetical protein Sango_1548600 [Sesamum angolense]|uniref:Uncharacterized protein n=1 Tax=Sesamum angolense TaxID=2727404 RepID=A0AAE1WPH5_9LAMI|nr:hypothetical protein Sango_1548600 [Sesamum angolense]